MINMVLKFWFRASGSSVKSRLWDMELPVSCVGRNDVHKVLLHHAQHHIIVSNNHF